MSTDDDLRTALRALAERAPDSGPVLDRIAGRVARRHRARQAVAAGGAVLAVSGIVAGSAVLHRTVGTQSAATTPATTTAATSSATAAPTATTPAGVPSRRPTAGSAPPPAEAHAFAAHGYDRDDAAELARLWQAPDTGMATAIAGRWLLDGGALPIEPGHHSSKPPTNYVAQSVYRFIGAGHDYADAVALAKVWKTPDPYTAKAVAGQMLLDGRSLPVH